MKKPKTKPPSWVKVGTPFWYIEDGNGNSQDPSFSPIATPRIQKAVVDEVGPAHFFSGVGTTLFGPEDLCFPSHLQAMRAMNRLVRKAIRREQDYFNKQLKFLQRLEVKSRG